MVVHSLVQLFRGAQNSCVGHVTGGLFVAVIAYSPVSLIVTDLPAGMLSATPLEQQGQARHF